MNDGKIDFEYMIRHRETLLKKLPQKVIFLPDVSFLRWRMTFFHKIDGCLTFIITTQSSTLSFIFFVSYSLFHLDNISCILRIYDICNEL